MTTRKKAASPDEAAQTPIARKKAAPPDEAAQTRKNVTVLPAGQTYRIRIDLRNIAENANRRSAAGALRHTSDAARNARPARFLPEIIVVDEADKVHEARAIRALGNVAFASVPKESLAHGVHILRGAQWLATTREAIELIND